MMLYDKPILICPTSLTATGIFTTICLCFLSSYAFCGAIFRKQNKTLKNEKVSNCFVTVYRFHLHKNR